MSGFYTFSISLGSSAYERQNNGKISICPTTFQASLGFKENLLLAFVPDHYYVLGMLKLSPASPSVLSHLPLVLPTQFCSCPPP